MRVDQVAVDVFWQAPDRSRQIIKATRKEELLPVRDFNYYIDRLTAVQNGFGDIITVGEGRDVNQVPHPLAPSSMPLYRYRVVGDLRLSAPGLDTPIRVVEVEVSPKSSTSPRFVGTLFLDAASGALTRMSFSFTPSSYIDPRVDRVHVDLEHSLWPGYGWLPFRQKVEVRREIPEIDLPVASVIRATLEVQDYTFEPTLDQAFFSGPAVSRPQFPDSTAFRQELKEHLASEGLTPLSLAEVEKEARDAVREHLVSGLPPLRLHIDGASSILRANRVEGVYAGLGASYGLRPTTTLRAKAGYGFGANQASGELGVLWTLSAQSMIRATAFGNELRDMGPFEGAAGVVNSVSSLFGVADYSDPFFSSGGQVELTRRAGSWTFGTWVTAEAHRRKPSAWRTSPFGGHRFRPLIPALEGTLVETGIQIERQLGAPDGWMGNATAKVSASRWSTRGDDSDSAVGFLNLDASFSATRFSTDMRRSLSMWVRGGGLSSTDAPPQKAFHLGGRGSAPGYRYRGVTGRGYVIAKGEAWFNIRPGTLSLRLFTGTGWVLDQDAFTPRPRMEPRWPTLPFAGIGVGTLHDMVRFDAAWGMRDGSVEVTVSANPRLRSLL